MNPLLTLVLEAHHTGRNHHRQYAVTVGRDLFGLYTLSLQYGRPGQIGHEQRFASDEPAELRKIIHERLLRRLSAPKRLGCAYQVKILEMAPGHHCAEWLETVPIASFDYYYQDKSKTIMGGCQ